jgi:ribosomal protein L7/L12
MTESRDVTLPGEALTALARGSKIEAIKILRQAKGIGLKEAKDEVEAYLDAHPETHRKLDQASATTGKSFLVTVIFIALVGALIYFGIQRFG